MHSEKFSDNDRKLVITELERVQKSKLFPLNSSKKLFVDTNGMVYIIFGGKNDWHGVGLKLIQEIERNKNEGALVIIKKYMTKMDVCVGSLTQFINHKDKLIRTQKGDLQFHTVLLEDGLYIKEIPKLYLNKVCEIKLDGFKNDLSKLKEISKIINIEVNSKTEVTHSDLQAKLILIGSYLGYRTYTPDKSKKSSYGVLGDLSSEITVPEGSIPSLSLDTVKMIDVIWFDDEGYPTNAFEVEHTTDITKGLLRLYQIHKLRIKMFIISEDENKFKKEVGKSPFVKIKNEFIFKNYDELDEFFESVKHFSKVQEKFLQK